MDEAPETIDEKTKIPLGLAVGVTIFICGLVLWAGRIEWVLSATAESQKTIAREVGEDKDKYSKDIQVIQSDLLAIKCHLGVKDPACVSFPRSRR